MPEFKSFEDSQKEGRRKKAALLLVVVTCVLAGGAFALWKIRQPSKPTPLPNLARQIVDARGAAQYDRALQLVAEGLQGSSDFRAIKTLAEDFERDLKPDIRLRCLKYGISPSAVPPPNACRQLTPADEFYFKVNLVGVPGPCYLYMFLVDSNGYWTVLVPNKAQAPNLNPLSPSLYQVPDNIDKKLRTPETAGAEKLFVVAAYWRIDALEDLAAALATETDMERERALGQQLLARLRLEDAKPAGIHGLSVGTFEFHNSGRFPVQAAEKR
jgi:hypothetical protein